MVTLIIYSPEDLNSISNTITRFLKQYKLVMLLKSYNAYKSKRVSVISIFEYCSGCCQQPFIVHELSYTKVEFAIIKLIQKTNVNTHPINSFWHPDFIKTVFTSILWIFIKPSLFSPLFWNLQQAHLRISNAAIWNKPQSTKSKLRTSNRHRLQEYYTASSL